MTSATMYLRVDPKVKDFFVKKAKEEDRPMNYYVTKVLEDVYAKANAKKATTTTRRRAKNVKNTKNNDNK